MPARRRNLSRSAKSEDRSLPRTLCRASVPRLLSPTIRARPPSHGKFRHLRMTRGMVLPAAHCRQGPARRRPLSLQIPPLRSSCLHRAVLPCLSPPNVLPLVNVLGYVEKEGGEKEGIVEIFGQMYLAHEGELLGGKFRVLQVTPSSVRIVDETRERSALPAKDRPEIEPVTPAVPGPGSPPGPQPRRRAYPVLVVPAADGHQSSPAKFALSQPPPKLPCRLAAESLSLPAMPDGERLIGAPLSLSPPAPEASVSEVDRPSPSAGQTAGKGVSASVNVSGALSFRLFMVCRRAAYQLPGTGFPGDAFEFKEAAMGVGTAALPSHHSPDFWPQHLSSGSALGAIGMTCRTSRAPTVPFYPKADLCSETVPNSSFAVALDQGDGQPLPCGRS